MLSQTTVFTQLVRNHMGPAPALCQPDTPCIDVVAKMKDGRSTSVIVVSSQCQGIGIITEQDVCRRIAFNAGETTPAKEVMTATLHTIDQDEFLYRAIAEMRRFKLRHMPVTNRAGEIVGVLDLDDSIASAAGQIIRHIDFLSKDYSFEGLCETKTAQKDVALELLNDTVPTPEIQWLLSSINWVIHDRVVRICLDEMESEGLGSPPVDFDVIIMGSGGRAESYLNPDQDNGFVIENYPESEHQKIDDWFTDLATRMTAKLDRIGFDYCVGQVMATNPRWRKTVRGHCDQVQQWITDRQGEDLRYCEIFFDFRCCYGSGELTSSLREYVTEHARVPGFLSRLYKLDQSHRGALNMFGQLVTDPNEGPNQGKIELKSGGTLPLIQAVRLLSLKEGLSVTSTRRRIERLCESNILNGDEEDYLSGAYEHISNLLLRQQLEAHRTGRPIDNHVPIEVLSEREKDMLIDGFRFFRGFHKKLKKMVSS